MDNRGWTALFSVVVLTAGADLGQGGGEGWGIWLNPLNKKMRYYSTLTWPHNTCTRNPISKDLSCKTFPGEVALVLLSGDHLHQSML